MSGKTLLAAVGAATGLAVTLGAALGWINDSSPDLDDIPPSASAYVYQSDASGTHYARMYMSDISATHSGIIGAMGYLCYTSAATQANKGVCSASTDSWSSETAIWGDSVTTADYSDGSTTNLYYKSAILSTVTNDTTVNALQVQIGLSDDATPDPYWIDIWVEVAYATSTSATLVAPDISHTHQLDAGVLVQQHTIVRQEISHTHQLDAVALVQNSSIVAQEISHTHQLDAVVLTVSKTLVAQDISHPHQLHAGVLTQVHILVRQEISHTHALDAVALSQVHNLTGQEISMATRTPPAPGARAAGTSATAIFARPPGDVTTQAFIDGRWGKGRRTVSPASPCRLRERRPG